MVGVTATKCDHFDVKSKCFSRWKVWRDHLETNRKVTNIPASQRLGAARWARGGFTLAAAVSAAVLRPLWVSNAEKPDTLSADARAGDFVSSLRM